MSVTSITRYRLAKPVTTAEVLDAYDQADNTTDWPELAGLLAKHLRHVMNLTTIPAPAPSKPVLRPLALLDLAQAEKYLADLDSRVQGADASAVAYLRFYRVEMTVVADTRYSHGKDPRAPAGETVARYNVRDVFRHFVKPRSAAGDACPHSCCRGYRIHPANLPLTLKPGILRRLSDDELSEHYGKHAGCDRCRHQVEKELDRRDRVQAARKATGQRNRTLGLERAEHVEREWLAAEAATRGNMVHARGRAIGVSERSLFTGSEDRAMRYASRELINYWSEHPRPTAASMSGNVRVRQKAYAGSNLGRQQASKRGTDPVVTVSVVRKRQAASAPHLWTTGYCLNPAK
jgi:hypothetical protein